MVTRCPTHQVMIVLFPSRYPSLEAAFNFNALANSFATLGFSAINKLLPKLFPLQRFSHLMFHIPSTKKVASTTEILECRHSKISTH